MPPTVTIRKPKRRPLPGLPQTALTPEQQLESLRRIQNQAEQRVKLGTQLFKAAEARVCQHQALLETLRAEQAEFRTKFSQDMIKSLQTYDQWVGQIEETLTDTLQGLEAKLDKLTAEWTGRHQHVETIADRAEALLNQTQELLQSTQSKLLRQTAAVREALVQRRATEASPPAAAPPGPDSSSGPVARARAIAILASSGADLGAPSDLPRNQIEAPDLTLDDTAEMEPIPTPPAPEAGQEPTVEDSVAVDKSRLYREVLEQLHEQEAEEEPPTGPAGWSIPP